jgi:hypothetical protein
MRKIYVPAKHVVNNFGIVHNEKLGDFYKPPAFAGTAKFESIKQARRVTRADANSTTIQNFDGETSWQLDTLRDLEQHRTLPVTKIDFLVLY